jgi:hypothetical protein
MATFLEELAQSAGLKPDQAHLGVGALLSLLKSRLDPQAFGHLQNSIPNASEVLAKSQSALQESGGGLLDTMKAVAGKLFGGSNPPDAESATRLTQAHFDRFGFSPDQLKNFLPAVGAMLAKKLPPDVLNQIREHVPELSNVDEEAIAKSGTT